MTMKQAKEQFISVSYDELLAENDMPRGVVTGLADRSFSEYEMNLLQSDNAKLRELATMLYRCAQGMLRDLAPSCVDVSKEGCGMDCTDNGERCCMELLERRARELGVEL